MAPRFPHGRAAAAHKVRGQRRTTKMPLTTDQQAEIDQARAGAQPTLRPIAPALEEILYQALPVLDHGFIRVDRLHGRRCRRRAGGARVLRPRHQEGQRGSRADQLSDAAPPHDAVRDVRDQVPREAADLRRAAVDPPPHRQRERILGALLDPRQRILHPRARASGGAAQGQPPGPRRGAGRRGGRARLRRCCAKDAELRLRALRGDAERGRGGRAARSRARRAWRASWRA